MDLSVSLDIEVFWSYLIVLVLGVFVAYRQVATRLEGLKDVWLVGDTWLVFFAYLAVPLGLFWLLDRTDAIKDTSLFAALLVGIGYERILAGTDAPLAAPQGLAGLWSPFVAYANRVAEKVRNAVRRADRRLEKRLLARILADADRYKALVAPNGVTPNGVRSCNIAPLLLDSVNVPPTTTRTLRGLVPRDLARRPPGGHLRGRHRSRKLAGNAGPVLRAI